MQRASSFAVSSFDEAVASRDQGDSLADVSDGTGLEEVERSIDDSCDDGDNAEDSGLGFHSVKA